MIELCCPSCGKVRTYEGSGSQVRCLKEIGGCGSKININKKHIVVDVSHFDIKSRTFEQLGKRRRPYPILNTDELRYLHKRLTGDSIRDKPNLIINSLIYNLEEIKRRGIYE